MGQCQSATSNVVQNAVTIVTDKTNSMKSDPINTTALTDYSAVGVLPNENQESGRKESLIEAHAKLSSQYFHSNAASERSQQNDDDKDDYEKEDCNYKPYDNNDDDVSCNTSASSASTIEEEEEDKNLNESCSLSLLSEFSTISQKISKEKKHQKYLDKKIVNEDKKYIDFLYSDFQENMKSDVANDTKNDDENRSVCTNITNGSMNLKDNSTWYIDFSNLDTSTPTANNDVTVNSNNNTAAVVESKSLVTPTAVDVSALPDYEELSLGESIHSLSSMKDNNNNNDEDEQENIQQTDNIMNYKVQRRRRVRSSSLDKEHDDIDDKTPVVLPLTDTIGTESSTINSTSETDDNKDNQIKKSLYNMMMNQNQQDDNNDSFDIFEMNDVLHPLDSDSDNDDDNIGGSIDSVPCSIQISVN